MAQYITIKKKNNKKRNDKCKKFNLIDMNKLLNE